MVKVKICGIQTIEAAKVAVEAGVDFLGFVFAPSSREIKPEEAAKIVKAIPSSVKTVGVFVNETSDSISKIVNDVGLDYVQLHGDESIEMTKSLPFKIIKAFSADQIENSDNYDTEYTLIDSPAEQYRGGTGNTFNWDLIDHLSINHMRLILAGGLNADNVQEAIRCVKPAVVDTSSGVETNGKKDHEKIKQFISKVKG